MSGARPEWAQSAFDELLTRVADADDRRQQFAAYLDHGLPDRKVEQWHYTDISKLADTPFVTAGMPESAPNYDQPSIPLAHRVVFGNGMYAAHLSEHDELAGLSIGRAQFPLPTTAAPLAALNAALATGGCTLRLAAGQVLDYPLHIDAWQNGSAEQMSHLRHRIELGEHAKAVVILEHRGQAGLSTHTIDIELAAGAELQLYRIQTEAADTSLVTRMDARVGAGANLVCCGVDVGGRLVRHDMDVQLLGTDANAELTCVYAIGDECHLDNQISNVHVSQGTRSRQMVRGVVGDKACAILNGRVVVRKDAQQSDSNQSVAHLMLNPGAEINAKPELEIYADDVKCAHGATVGQLDQAALHYLRTRGIAEPTARALLTHAFLQQALSGIAHESVRDLAETALRARLPEIPSIEDLA